MKKINVLIIGFFGNNNLGDDLLFYETLVKYPKGWNLVILGNKEKLERFKVFRNFNVISDIKNIIKKRFDIAIFSGGGQFPSRNFSFKQFLSTYILLSSSKIYVLNGIGIVPKNKKLHKLLFSLFLRKAKYISVRDIVSLKYVVECNYKNAINISDLYLGNNSEKLSSCFTKNKNEKIALVCLAQPFGVEELKKIHYEVRYNQFLNVMVKVMLHIESLGYKLYFIPFFKESDSQLLEDLNNIYPVDKTKILKEGIHFQLEEINDLFNQVDFGLCMRFHSKVLAIKSSLPFVGICYDYKSQSLLEECSISEIGIKYGIRKSQFFGEEIDISSEEIIIKINYAISNAKDLKEKMKVFADTKMKAIEDNYKEIIKLVKLE